jgi:hypothetical protein
VWQAVHLNIPPPGDPPYKQILRRVGWSSLAIIAPEVVALNAWLQFDDARTLMVLVNCYRGTDTEPDQTWLEQLLGYLTNGLGMLCISPVLVADRIRMLLRHNHESRAFKSEQRRLKLNDVMARLEEDQLPWTMDTAFYALCGGGVVLVDDQIRILDFLGVTALAKDNSRLLLPVQKAVLQDPSKASGLAKFITCAQAFWFCSQCIARLSQDMAISLLELNTFAHCISAFFIYLFWWYKPYDVATCVYIDTTELLSMDLDRYTRPRGKNMDGELFSSTDWARAGISRPLIMFLTFLVYGAIHSLAWGYHFPTPAEGIVWRCASVATASSGLILLVTIIRGSLRKGDWKYTWKGPARSFLHVVMYFLCFVAIAARSFLVVESFRALPNSPASIYEVPRWTAYIPHI